MFRKISTTETASIARNNDVVIMCSDGFEDILSRRVSNASHNEALAFLTEAGFEEYDPNASLKAAGLVWRDGCYR